MVCKGKVALASEHSAHSGAIALSKMYAPNKEDEYQNATKLFLSDDCPVEITETGACDTHYKVGGVPVRLWIITGGQPCIAFDDYSFDQRFPIKDERYTNEHWSSGKGLYDHQKDKKLDSPKAEDVLPKGIESIKAFVAENYANMKVRQDRYAVIHSHFPWGRINSTKGMNYDFSRCKFNVDLRSNYIPSGVSLSSDNSSTHLDWIKKQSDQKDYNRIPKEWKALDSVLSGIKEKYGDNAKWEQLSEEDYGTVLEKLFELDEKSMISK